MQHFFVPYKVKAEAVDTIKKVVARFISKIEKNEPGTLFYKSFQEEEDPTRFVHIMTFANTEAQRAHKKSAYCTEFTNALYPLCEIMPHPINYIEIH
ncbi:MAG: antibiotic biosynthesis monooxygenase family protein [Flavobacteriaceae bacterium]